MVNLRRYNKVFYDDYPIHDYAVIKSIRTKFMPPITNNYWSNPNVDGARYRQSTLGQISVEIDLFIEDDVLYNLDQLRKILFTRENKILVIGDQKEKYLLCKLEGDITPSSRYKHSEFTLKFISPNAYWSSTAGPIETQFRYTTGRVVLENKGTAPTPVSFEVNFVSDCGFLSIVGPDRAISVGNIKEQDKIAVQPSEYALNEEMHTVSGWQRISNAQNYIPDYVGLTSLGGSKHDEWGMLLDPNISSNPDVWNGHAYMRRFDKGAAEVEARNFELMSRVDINDNSGTKTNTMAMLIVVMDDNDIPIMTTSVYDASFDKNELIVTCKIHGKNKKSNIIHTGKLSNLNGYIKMNKMGTKFDWEIYNSKSVVNETKALAVGDIVHLKSDVKDVWHTDGSKLRFDQSVINQRMRVEGYRSGNNGNYLLHSVDTGWPVGYFNANQIKEATINSETGPQTVKFSVFDSSLAQLKPTKVFVWMAKWGSGGAYSKFSLNSVVVKRIYTTTSLEIENTFMAGDKLEINGRTSEVLLNGKTFEGLIDVDSRPIYIEGGKTELALVKSSWAVMPLVKAYHESRWLG